MRLENDWGECPHCGSSALVTWLRSYSRSGNSFQQSSVRVRIRCLNQQCPGPDGEPPL